jgi:hypothetical protein
LGGDSILVRNQFITTPTKNYNTECCGWNDIPALN